MGKKIKGNGNIVTKQIVVEQYSAINMDSRVIGSSNNWLEQLSDKELPIYEFFYEQDKHATLVFTIDENLFPFLKVSTSNGELSISTPNKELLLPTTLAISGTSRSLKKINITGDIDFIVNSTLTGEYLDIISRNNCNIVLRYEATMNYCSVLAEKDSRVAFNGLICDSIICKSSGNSDIKLMGKAKKAYYEVSSESDIRANSFAVSELECSAKGSSNILSYATKQLNALIKGGSTLRYRGNPQTNTKISKSSDFIQERY